MERKNELVGALDAETDPFLAGRIPKPFAWCIYFNAKDFAVLWDSDMKTPLLVRILRALRKLPECVLYAHNGGKFDFHFLIEDAEPQTLQIRNGRVVSLRIGKVTLKDSFPLMPFALDEYNKTKIDYRIFEKKLRNKRHNRERITDYLISDCANLLTLITGFRDIVGPRDTIGSAAFFQMRKLGMKIYSASEAHDDVFRPYYFGGRVEAFARGLHRGPLQYLDINSAYPFSMCEDHPHGPEYFHSRCLPKRLGGVFVRLMGDSRGALPRRADNGGLEFPYGRGEFYATGWEVAAGIKTKTLTIDEVLDVWTPQSIINFREYVSHFYALRKKAKDSGDKIRSLAYKYLLNSGYGKFAQNPREFKEYRIAPFGKNVRGFDWETDFGAMSLWSRPSYRGWGFFDVATSASITGFVRAMLWRAINHSRGVIYCDTDSMICKSSDVRLGTALGEWKLEGRVERAAIAGKKLYAVRWSKPQDGLLTKIASKGARLSMQQVIALCSGKRILWANEAPTFSLGNPHFIRRVIRST